jgi:hypothetical protein
MKISLDTSGYSRLALQHPELVKCVDEADAVYLSCLVNYSWVFVLASMRKRTAASLLISLSCLESVSLLLMRCCRSLWNSYKGTSQTVDADSNERHLDRSSGAGNRITALILCHSF